MTHDPDGSAALRLPAKPNLDKLKKDAKQLLCDFRAGDAAVRHTVEHFHPRPAAFFGLRDAQLTLARRYGYPDWEQVRSAVELKLLLSGSLKEQAELFAADACLRYGGDDRVFRYQRATAMLQQEPKLAYVNLHSALAAGNLEAVRQKLDADASQINVPCGPLQRPPMLYLTYSRVPAPGEQVLGIMRLLLDKGADPDSHVKLDGGDTHFSAMTGAMGEGERGPISCVPHACADELVTMLLEAGANPNDAQGLYNTQFTGSIDKWLRVLMHYGLNAGHKAWGENPQSTFDYFLAQAAAEGKFARVQFLVEHGADPNAINRYNGHSCYSLALMAGHEAMAEWLLGKGAKPRPLTTEDRYWIACRKGDRSHIAALLQKHPELLNEPALLRGATHFGLDFVLWLVEQGFDINGQTKDGRTLLMDYAQGNDVDAVQRLLQRGADADMSEFHYRITALGFALHNRHWQVIDFLAAISNNILEVSRVPHLERARYLLNKDSSLVSRRTPMGNTPLHLVSQARDLDIDVEASADLIDLLLAHGANLEAKNKEGLTPLQWYRKLGVDDMVELLQERGAQLSG